MIRRFEFSTASRIIVGSGAIREVGSLAAAMGRRSLIVTRSGGDTESALQGLLAEAGLGCTFFRVGGEPTTDDARRAVQMLVEEGCDLVVGCGGGSVLDTAKAAAALAGNGGDPLDYLDVIGRGLPLAKPSLPSIAIPTTAGTGAEVTRNAVLASPEHHMKVSLRGPHVMPRLALVDPDLTHSMPRDVTATTGLDALTQLVEPYVSARANPIADVFCRNGMQRVARSLRRAYADGADVGAREDMSIASLYGGLALANAGLGAAHGFASPIGGMFDAPHGAICASLLPYTIEVNSRALEQRSPDGAALRRYDEVAQILTGNPGARSADGAAYVRDLCSDLGVPPLRAYGLTVADVAVVVSLAAGASGMQANPIGLTHEEMTEILERAL